MSPSFDSPTLLTPQSQTSGSSFSRSSSALSAASIASLGLGDGESQLQDEHFQASGEDNDGDATDDDDSSEDGGYDGMKKNSRGKRVVYSVEDRTLVTTPILMHLDSSFLAPTASELYIQGKLKQNGTVKKHADLDFDTFKGMIKPIIRELAVDCSGPNVYQRLFWAAYDVVRKRRANHVQSWRLYGHPKELIYGGKEKFVQTHGNVWATSKNAKKKNKKRRRRRVNKIKVESPALPGSQASINQPIAVYLSNYLSSIPIIHVYYTFIFI